MKLDGHMYSEAFLNPMNSPPEAGPMKNRLQIGLLLGAMPLEFDHDGFLRVFAPKMFCISFLY